MKAIARLYQYFEYKHIKPTRFEKDLGLSNGYLGSQMKREADIGSSILEKIIVNCLDLNIKWLITGEGNMLSDKGNSVVCDLRIEPKSDYSGSLGCELCKTKDVLIEVLRRQVNTQLEMINYLKELKSPREEGQKRKAVS